MPTVTLGGVVPIYGIVPVIQPGELVSIYGTNLAAAPTTWNGDFPTSLGSTSVTIDGKPGYLWYVSSTQINLQAPDDMTTGLVAVVVNTPGGSSTTTVSLAPFAPSFCLLDGKHVAGEIARPNGTGAYGNGSYDVVGPTGSSLGYPTVAAKAGDAVALFVVGLGPTSPPVPSGQAFSGAANVANPVSVFINGVSVTPSFAGLIEAGLYQVNVTIPGGLGTGDVPLQISAGGVLTPTGVVISLQ
jgi:uncharacterized protein (TIGR03437 family)